MVITGGELTVIVSILVENSPSTSTSFNVNVNTPVTEGVPVIAPVSLFRVSPAGNRPSVIDHAPEEEITALP